MLSPHMDNHHLQAATSYAPRSPSPAAYAPKSPNLTASAFAPPVLVHQSSSALSDQASYHASPFGKQGMRESFSVPSHYDPIKSESHLSLASLPPPPQQHFASFSPSHQHSPYPAPPNPSPYGVNQMIPYPDIDQSPAQHSSRPRGRPPKRKVEDADGEWSPGFDPSNQYPPAKLARQKSHGGPPGSMMPSASNASALAQMMQIPPPSERLVAPGEKEGIVIKTKFPVARIKRLVQADEDIGKVAQVTPVVVGRALELFMTSLALRSAEQARARNSKRITGFHLKQTVQSESTFDFLSEIVAKIPDAPTASSASQGQGQSQRGKRPSNGGGPLHSDDDQDNFDPSAAADPDYGGSAFAVAADGGSSEVGPPARKRKPRAAAGAGTARRRKKGSDDDDEE